MTQYEKLTKGLTKKLTEKRKGHTLQDEINTKQKLWEHSPFKMVHFLSSSQRGKLAKELVAEWLQDNGLKWESSPIRDLDLIVEGYKCQIRFSTLWEGNHYQFQQIRKTEYDYLICLGIRPNGADIWIGSLKEIASNWNTLTEQHGKETIWVSISPKADSDKDTGLFKGGDIEKGYKKLCEVLKTKT